ncbi:MAG: hypothetical protein MJ252_04070, partial [archaeon]|nr:hypothetical protein [archaeon]
MHRPKGIIREVGLTNILKLTKSYIQNGTNYEQYYRKKETNLFENQLPMLASVPNTLLNKSFENSPAMEVFKSQSEISMAKIEELRYKARRPKALPPLCPFYDEEGKINQEIVRQSQAKYPKYFITETSPERSLLPPRMFFTEKKKEEKKVNELLFNGLMNETFFDKQKSLNKLELDNLFSSMTKEEMKELSFNEVEKMKEKTYFDSHENITDCFHKTFTYNKSCGNKPLDILVSLQAMELKVWKVSNGESMKKMVQEIGLPFGFVYFLYSKGEDAFKFLLSKVLKFDQSFKKIEIDYSLINKIIQSEDIFKFSKPKEEEKKEEEIIPPTPSNNPLLKTALKNTPSVTNIIRNISEEEDLEEKEIFHYTSFSFYWISPVDIFKVDVHMPYLQVSFKNYNVTVKKFLEKELYFFLLKNNYLNWDFYVLSYLSSFIRFRQIMLSVLSHDKVKNHTFVLSELKEKKNTFNNTDIITLFTDKQLQNYILTFNNYEIKVNKIVITEEQFELEEQITDEYKEKSKVLFSLSENKILTKVLHETNHYDFLKKYLYYNGFEDKLYFDYNGINEFIPKENEEMEVLETKENEGAEKPTLSKMRSESFRKSKKKNLLKSQRSGRIKLPPLKKTFSLLNTTIPKSEIDVESDEFEIGQIKLSKKYPMEFKILKPTAALKYINENGEVVKLEKIPLREDVLQIMSNDNNLEQFLFDIKKAIPEIVIGNVRVEGTEVEGIPETEEELNENEEKIKQEENKIKEEEEAKKQQEECINIMDMGKEDENKEEAKE